MGNQIRLPNELDGVMGSTFTFYGALYTVGAIGVRDGERYIMATDDSGGVLLWPWDTYVRQCRPYEFHWREQQTTESQPPR